MSLIFPGIDKQHIIKQALNSKSLQKLGKEHDAYIASLHPKKADKDMQGYIESAKRYYYNSPRILTKEDLVEFRESCKNKTPDEIFKKLGFEVAYTKDGSKVLSEYYWPFKTYSFKTAGIDEEKLLKDVKRIERNCDLTGSSLKSLGEVESIGKDLIIPIFGPLEDASSVKYIGRNIICESESGEEVLKKLEAINLNPEHFKGVINSYNPSRPGYCPALPSKMTDELKKMMAYYNK